MMHSTTSSGHLLAVLAAIYGFFVAVSAETLTLNVEGLGSVSVPDTAEPVDVVIRFAREVSKQGDASLGSRSALEQLMNYFCTKRQCARKLPETLRVNSLEPQLVVEPWHEPADVIEQYLLAQLDKTGQAPSMSIQQATSILSQICAQTICFKGSVRMPELPTTLNVEGIGKITVGALQDPADAVENFAQLVVDKGIAFGFEQMKELMEYFCKRRTCSRLELVPPTPKPEALDLEIKGVGKITVLPTQDPADVVEEFTRQARAAKFLISGEDMIKMMEYFCARRSCNRRQLNPDVGMVSSDGIKLNVEGVGSVTCLPDQEPADVVEAFSRKATEAGIQVGTNDLVSWLTYFCERRSCLRLEINPENAGVQAA